MSIQYIIDKWILINENVVLNIWKNKWKTIWKTRCIKLLLKTSWAVVYNNFFLFYSYPQENICLESKKTTVIVNHCPGNIDAFNKRSKKKNCDSYAKCAGESLVYHCVRSRGIFVEVCAPRNLIIGARIR